MHQVIFYPVGNGDTCQIVLENGKRILLDYRLDEACRLLRHTDDSIEAIAETCGLVNRHYFSRMMRQYRNTSPAAYRSEQS